ncbi:bzip transcription factor [Lentinula edodes]|uniref:Bzip transcription factor n=1 Tax=Lentinula edodes TaxID=5353 RepID=A0A1Q3ECB7_LENED|nr:bzip transcription factor [Lentinula edodes]
MMLSLKDFDNPQDKASDTSLLNPNIDSELEHWEKLVFSFDMDVNQQGQGSNAPMLPRADVQDALLLAQFSAGGLPQPQASHDPAYNALLLALLQAQHSQHAPPNFPPAMSQQVYGQHSVPQPSFGSIPSQYQWPPPPTFSQQQQNFPYNQLGMSAHATGYPNLPQINTNVAMGTPDTSSAAVATSSSSPPTAVSRTESPDPTDPSVTEDKRRRNTAASGNTVLFSRRSPLILDFVYLTGRADELEKEAADLRRENGWLKEIVMLKGSRFAGLDVSPQNLPKPPEGDASFWGPANTRSSQPVASSSRKPTSKSQEVEDSDSENDSDGYSEAQGSKGGASGSKGKERQK